MRRPSQTFRVLHDSISEPRVLIEGREDCVSVADKNLLRDAIRKGESRDEIQSLLSAVNARASASSGGSVSENCWVSSIWLDGKDIHSSNKNLGQVEGHPHMIMDGMDVSKQLRDALGTEFQGRRLIQSVSTQGKGKPLRPPTGERKKFHLRSPALNIDLRPLSSVGDSFRFEPIDMIVELEKNRPFEIDIAQVELSIDSKLMKDFPEQRFPPPSIDEPLTIEGERFAERFRYTYTFCGDKIARTLRLSPSSCGVRNKTFLASDEEFVIVRPTEPLRLVADAGADTVRGSIRARLWWRSRADGSIG